MSGVYFLQSTEASASNPSVVGAKAAALNRLLKFQMQVPEGFTISTKETEIFLARGAFAAQLESEFQDAINQLERLTRRKLGSVSNPLLVSVRSGAPVSMPGMLDTVLNVGINDEIAASLNAATDERFAADLYCRFLRSFGDVVFKLPGELLSGIDGLKTLSDVHDVKQRIEKNGGVEFPSEAEHQLRMARNAVCLSWRSPRAAAYRRLTDVPESYSSAVTVQRMVFGNRDDFSAAGIGFTRNPFTGKRGLYGELIFRSQGTDLASGVRTPKPLTELQLRMPDVYEGLTKLSDKLETILGTAQQFEFTIESKVLYLLQSRESLQMIHLERSNRATNKDRSLVDGDIIGSGLPASPGLAKGRIALLPTEVMAHAQNGEPSILVRAETSPEDVVALKAAEGVLTCRGGVTSHAAAITRGMGIPCVVGVADCSINIGAKQLRIGENILSAGDWIAIDGTTGLIYSSPTSAGFAGKKSQKINPA